MLPFSVYFLILSLFIGRKRAAGKTGKMITNFSALFINSMIPEMHNQSNFIEFKNTLIKNFMSYTFLYDIDIQEETNEKVAFKIHNCPFTSALKDYGTKELCKYACAGDFKIARNNKLNWQFKRTHSHGTDGQCCNPSYFMVKESNNKADECL